MSSLVEELQRDALTESTPVSQLLRKAKVVASKLDLDDFKRWVENELDGYSAQEEVPSYRYAFGQLKAFNPYRGWIPVILPDSMAFICEQRMEQRVADLEKLSESKADFFQISFGTVQMNLLRKLVNPPTDVRLEIPFTTVTSALDAVRNITLDWSLRLEKLNIRGNGMSFSDKDKQIARSPQITYQIDRIENFTGQMGSVGDHSPVSVNVAPGSPALLELCDLILKNSEKLGLDVKAEAHLNSTAESISTAVKNSAPESKIKALLDSAKAILQSASANLIAKGILFEFSKLGHH